MRINTREELEKSRRDYQKSLVCQKKQILICAGTGCVAGGSLQIYERMQQLMEEKNIPCSIWLEEEPHGETIGLKKSGCHGFCEMGPLLRIEPMGWLYIKVKVEDCEEILEKSILGDEVIDRLVYKDAEGNPYPVPGGDSVLPQPDASGTGTLRSHQCRIHKGIHCGRRLFRDGEGSVRYDADGDHRRDHEVLSARTWRRRFPDRQEMGAGAGADRSGQVYRL